MQVEVFVGEVIDLAVLGEQTNCAVTEEESAHAASRTLANQDGPPTFTGMGDGPGLGGAKGAAECLAAGFHPGTRRCQGAPDADALLFQTALLVLGGCQGAVRAPVILEEFVSAVETDQATLGYAI